MKAKFNWIGPSSVDKILGKGAIEKISTSEKIRGLVNELRKDEENGFWAWNGKKFEEWTRTFYAELNEMLGLKIELKSAHLKKGVTDGVVTADFNIRWLSIQIYPRSPVQTLFSVSLGEYLEAAKSIGGKCALTDDEINQGVNEAFASVIGLLASDELFKK